MLPVRLTCRAPQDTETAKSEARGRRKENVAAAYVINPRQETATESSTLGSNALSSSCPATTQMTASFPPLLLLLLLSFNAAAAVITTADYY